MTLEEAVIDNLRNLPLDKQQELLAFAQFLRQRTQAPEPQPHLRGLWDGVHIGEDDISDVRREMWSNHPRENL
jgi:hypothetical protein